MSPSFLRRPIFAQRNTEEVELQDADRNAQNPFRSPTHSLLSKQPEQAAQLRRHHDKAKPDSILKNWSLELFSWFVSLVFLIAVVIVLWRFNGRPQPDWPYDITVNAVIALLGNFAEGFMMMCVASAVGQLKWTRARVSRPLDDFRAVDDATRGAYGSLLLLLRFRGGILASIGAVISILALAFGLFIQQTAKVVTLYPSQALSNASLPIASLLDGKDYYKNPQSDGASYGLDQGMQEAAYTGVYSALGTMFNATATCTTGNCSWQPYQTLAICNTCANLTDSIVQRTVQISDLYEDFESYNYTLDANGFGLSGAQLQINTNLPAVAVRSTLRNSVDQGTYPSELPPRVSSIAFQGNGSTIFGVIAMGMSPGTIPTQTEDLEQIYNDFPMALPVAYECLLQFCLKTYQANFTGATLTETLLETSIDNTQTGSNYTWTTAGSATEPTSFSVTELSYMSLSSYLATYLLGAAFFIGTVPGHDNQPVWNFTQGESQMLPIIQAMNQSSDGFPKLMDNLAASMSLAMRKLPYQPYEAQGIAVATEVIIQVRWAWLAFPFTLLLVTLILLVSVIVASTRTSTAAWKNSVLAVVLHGLNPIPAHAEALNRMDDIQSFAQKTPIRFERQDVGGRLVIT